MTTRLLPPSEWPRLAGTEVDPVWPRLPPGQSRVLVIEDEGEIVGTLVLVTFVHAECLWIHPDYRRGVTVLRRLLDGLWAAAQDLGVTRLWSGSVSDGTSDLLRRLGGTEIPGRSFVFPTKES